MSITQNAFTPASAAWAVGTSISITSLNVAAVSNTIMRVGVSQASTTDVVDSTNPPTYGGNAFTTSSPTNPVKSQAAAASVTTCMWVGVNPVTGSGKTLTVTLTASINVSIGVDCWDGVDQTTVYGTTHASIGNDGSPTDTIATVSGDIVVGNLTHTAVGGSFTTNVGTLDWSRRAGPSPENGGSHVISAGATATLSWKNGYTNYWAQVSAVLTAAAAAGIAFDAASNSGDKLASSSYTFNRTVAGSNTFLAVDVAVLSAGASVTSVIDDSAGGAVPLTFIGKRATVTSLGTIECWGLVAPAAGTKAIQVNLSGSIESIAGAVSYTGVHQTSPTEAFNSNQATNVGATDATVSITSVANNDWPHAAVVSDDTTITANQTSRNNVGGTAGSGADEDTGPITPAGATTMSYTNVGALATWAIAGYAIRPTAADNIVGPIYSVGAAVATLRGASLASDPISAAGAAVATLSGESLASGVMSITGAAVGTMASASLASGAFSTTGAATTAFEGAAVNSGQGSASAAGVATVTMTGAGTGTGAASVVSLATVKMVGRDGNASPVDRNIIDGCQPNFERNRRRQMTQEERDLRDIEQIVALLASKEWRNAA